MTRIHVPRARGVMTVRGQRGLREPRGCSAPFDLMTDVRSSTREGPAMRGGGIGWREDSSWSSAVWIMWITGSSARGDADPGWGGPGGPTGDNGRRGVGGGRESPGGAVPAHGVHRFVRRPMWVTRAVVPALVGRPAGRWVAGRPPVDDAPALGGCAVDGVGRVARDHGIGGYPQDYPQAVDLWTSRGKVDGPRARPRHTHRLISGRTGWGESCGQLWMTAYPGL